MYLKTFQLKEADHPRIQASNVLLNQLKRDNAGENKLKFNATILTCADPNLSTPEIYSFSVFVRTAPDVDFVPLSGNINIPKETAGAFRMAWDPCTFE